MNAFLESVLEEGVCLEMAVSVDGSDRIARTLAVRRSDSCLDGFSIA